MSTMKEIITMYMESKCLAWADTTQRSEAHRLNAMLPALDGKPSTLWKHLKDKKPYTRVTCWTRVVDLYDWAILNGHLKGPNAYELFRKTNAKQFKHCYNPKLPEMSYEEAKARVQGITDSRIREAAMALLHGGLRYCELKSFDSHSQTVVGKGAKHRRVYLPEGEGPNYQGTYTSLLRKLRAVGLTPHVLRKLAATELARRGLGEADLCAVMGWESFTTAKSYIAPVNQDRLAAVFKDIQGRKPDESTNTS